jgi:hypothetical protein
MLMNTELSIIIVNYNTRDLLRDCLASIPPDEVEDCEVIVVDNASQDDSCAMVRNQFPWVRLIESPVNGGFSKGNNLGIRAARGKYILLLNSDTIVRPGALRCMVEFLEAHPDAGGATCRLLNADGTIQACAGSRPGPLMLALRLTRISRVISGDRSRTRIRKYLGPMLGATIRTYLDPYVANADPVEVDNIGAACLMLRRRVIDEVGLLDEEFFMYLEDVDYCVRIRNAGWRLFYLPDKEILHLVGASSGGRMRNYSVHAYRSLFYLYRKHYSPWLQRMVRLLVFVCSSIQWLWNAIGSLLAQPQSVHRENRIVFSQVIRLCLK